MQHRNHTHPANDSMQFCTAPSDNHAILEREPSSYDQMQELKQQMLIKKHSYKQQYASIYYVRLLKLRHLLVDVCRSKWMSLPGNVYIYMEGTLYIQKTRQRNLNISTKSWISSPANCATCWAPSTWKCQPNPTS